MSSYQWDEKLPDEEGAYRVPGEIHFHGGSGSGSNSCSNSCRGGRKKDASDMLSALDFLVKKDVANDRWLGPIPTRLAA
jgi:hypothetical protein